VSASESALTVALITEVFHGPDCPDRLLAYLEAASRQGAELALLPELPLQEWCAVRRTRSAADAEPAGGSRHRAMARAAREAGIALLGGAIVDDPLTGKRHNTAIAFDPSGELITRYRKVHIPFEDGFWEADHYEPGDELPRPFEVAGFPLGVQICSDANRPELSHLLGAMGALALLVPRATPPETFERWRLVLRANAVTSTAYVVSVNRPMEPGSPVGGPSIAVAPDGTVLLETSEPLALVRLDRSIVEAARVAYPGYLAVASDLYARGWSAVAEEASVPQIAREPAST
jgi:predicted amidohydrolase